MEKDPKKLNPLEAGNRTYPNQLDGSFVAPKVTDMLPSIFRTDTNKKLIGALAEDLFQPSSLEDLNFSVGRNTSKTVVKQSLPHATAKRQLEAGLIYYADTGPKTLLADQIATIWDLNDRSNESAVPVSVLDLPIDPDKFVNWTNYYWIEQGLPVAYLGGAVDETFSVASDIIGKTFYTSLTQKNGQQLTLKNGMRIVFQDIADHQQVNGDLTLNVLATGNSEQLLDLEFSGYNKTKIQVFVAGILKQTSDYVILGNTIKWKTAVPTVGTELSIVCPDYYLNDPELPAVRRWQVAGVGSASGIKLLGRTHQYTNTVYSNAVQTLWDQTAVSWDSVEWDGAIRGINQKHYVCMEVGTETRTAHSRVNVWYHYETIQALVNFLELSFNDIAVQTSKATRPIVEFENSLELYNNGEKFTTWPNLALDPEVVQPSAFVGLPLKTTASLSLDSAYVELMLALNLNADLYVKIKFGDRFKTAVDKNRISVADYNRIKNEENKVIYEIAGDRIQWLAGHEPNTAHVVEINYRVEGVFLKDLRILWLGEGQQKNKIVTVFNNGQNITSWETETPFDLSTVVVDTPYADNKFYLQEYHWKDGQAVLSDYRKTWTQLPRFEIYDANHVKLSTNPVRPLIINSTIVEPVVGDLYDNESGYKLKFLPSQFNDLSEDNTIRNAMYDIVYSHTLHKQAYYDENRITKNIRGPYSFRRISGTELGNELSIGYRRAWFKMRSWAQRLVNITGETLIPIDVSMWPTYNWALTLDQDNATVCFTDDYSAVVDNCAVAALGETVTFTNFIPNLANVTGLVKTQLGDEFEITTDNTGSFNFIIPEDAGSFMSIELGDFTINIRIINVKNDPRNTKVKLNGLSVDYSFVKTDGVVSLSVNGTGSLEIAHQGNFTSADSVSAIPGVELNPEQNISLGEFTASRLVNAMNANINANKLSDEQVWIDSPRIKAFNGALMADHSSMRAAWSSGRLAPTLQDAIVARSLSAWRWYRKFISKIDSNNDLLSLTNVQSSLDRILEELLLGVTYSSPDAISGMAYSTKAMALNVEYGDGLNSYFNINTAGDTLYTGVYGNDHVYVYINDELQSKNSYSVFNGRVSFVTAPADEAEVKIYYGNALNLLTGIPASPTKLGLASLYRPEIITESWGANQRKYILRHDGSKVSLFGADESDIRNQILLEFENRVYIGCMHEQSVKKRLETYNAKQNTVLDTQSKAQLAWYAMNNLDFRNRDDFDSANPWTWNYNGESWRAMYRRMFGTDQLHLRPWESLGFTVKPIWWDSAYSWTDGAKRTSLENALRNGIISVPGSAVTINPVYCRRYEDFPVDQFGVLIDPAAWTGNSPEISDAEQPWEIGSMGPAEVAWLNSSGGQWAKVMQLTDSYEYISEFVETSIDPFVTNIPTNSPLAKGDISFAPSEFLQDRPAIGLGALLFESYREFNLLGESPLVELMSVNARLEFGLGGFSEGNISLKMYYTKYQSGSYVPTEDFFMMLNDGVPVEKLRYSAVRIEKDDVGFRVYGFDPSKRYFKVYKPANATQNGFPSSRTTIATSNGEFIEYLKWIPTEETVPYGSYIANKQDLLTFLMGLGEYQTAQGLVLDEINSRGTITNWKQVALDAFIWIDENWADSHYCVVGPVTTNGLKFHHDRGTLDRLDADLGRTGKILFQNGRSALGSELLITRDYEENTDKIVPLSNQQILFADLSVREYEHIVYINRQTKFGDLIVDLQTGNRLDSLAIAGRRTTNWSGRPHARGVIVQQYGLLPGFDSISNDILKSHFPENNAFDSYKSAIARSDVVPAKANVIGELIQDKTQAHLYQQGLQSSAGTNLAMTALLRDTNIDVPGRSQDILINEQWLFNTGEFGNVKDLKVWEFELGKYDVTTSRQLVRLSNGLIDKFSDNIIDINLKDNKWVTKPVDPFKLTKINRQTQATINKTTAWLPSAGVPLKFDVDIQHRNIASVTFDDFKNIDQTSKNNNLLYVDESNTLTTKDIFTAVGFGKTKSFVTGDLTWDKGLLYRAKTNIAASSTNDTPDNLSDIYEQVSIDSRLLPTVWITDYAYSLVNKKGRNYRGAWTPGVDYSVGDVVYRNGLYYTCTIPNLSGEFIQSRLDSLTIVDGGEGHTTNDTINFSSEVGSGASASVLETVNGKIRNFKVVQSGNNYETQQTYLTIGGQRADTIGFKYKINYKDIGMIDASSSGIISSVTPSVGSKFVIGNNYSKSSVEISVVDSHGTGAKLVPIIEDQITTGIVTRRGIIQSTQIDSGGSGYQVGDSITIKNNNNNLDATATVQTVSDPLPATGTANVSGGSVTSITPVTTGLGYVTAPTVTIAAPPPATQSLFSNYSSTPSLQNKNQFIQQDASNSLIAWVDGISQNSLEIDVNTFISTYYNVDEDPVLADKWTSLGLSSWAARVVIQGVVDTANLLMRNYIGSATAYVVNGNSRQLGIPSGNNQFTGSDGKVYTRGAVASSNVNWSLSSKITSSVKNTLLTNLMNEYSNYYWDTEYGINPFQDPANQAKASAEFSLIIDLVSASYNKINSGKSVTIYNYTVGSNTTPRQATATAVISQGSVVSYSITDSGAGYTSAPAVTVAPPGASGKSIASIALVSPGQAYQASTVYEVSGGSGSGARIRVVSVTSTQTNTPVIDNGVITGFIVSDGGKNYSGTTTVRVSRTPTVLFPDSSRQEYRRAFSTISNGRVSDITLNPSAQSNVYAPGDIVIQIINAGTGGNGATALPQITNGRLTGITVTNGGSGYTSAPLVRIIDPYWANDVIEVTVNLNTGTAVTGKKEVGKIDSITIFPSAQNVGFSSASAVTVVDPTGNGAGAVLEVSHISNGVISKVTSTFTDTTGGAGYVSPPVVSVTGGSSDYPAVIKANIKSYWVVKNSGYGWNILQTFGPHAIEEVCPNALNTGLNESKVSFANAHGLREGDYFVISGCNDGAYDKIHSVKAVVDDYNVTIEARSSDDKIVYNVVAFNLLPVKFESTFDFEETKGHYNWKAGMKAYVDKDDDELLTGINSYNFKVYEFQNDGQNNLIDTLVDNVSQDFIDTSVFYKALLIDTDTQQPITTLEIYDPYKGNVIDEVAQYINYRSPIDPAVYNVDELGITDETIAEEWSANEVGKLWWDISWVRYDEYEQGTLEYRAASWGQQAVDSEVRVYEWVSSVEEPDADTPGIYLDNSSGAEQPRYSRVNEKTTAGGTVETFYYWKRRNSELPTNSTRPYSALAIEEVLNNPDAEGVAWMSPIDNDLSSVTFLISNINDYFVDRNNITVRVEQISHPEQKHEAGVLISEGITGSKIPDYLFGRLRDSLVSYDGYRHSNPILYWQANTAYKVGDIVCFYDLNNSVAFSNTSEYSGHDMPVLQEINGERNSVSLVWTDDNTEEFGVYKVIRAVIARDNTDWSSVKSNAELLTGALIKDIIEDNRYYVVTEHPRRVPDYRLHSTRKYGNSYVPYPQSWFKDLQRARRSAIESINAKLLKIPVCNKTDWDKNLRLYRPLLGRFVNRQFTYLTSSRFNFGYRLRQTDIVIVMLNGVELLDKWTIDSTWLEISASMTRGDIVEIHISTNPILYVDPESYFAGVKPSMYIWDYADYSVDGYTLSNEAVRIKTTDELVNYPSATRFAIVDDNDNTLFVYDVVSNGYNLLYKKNGTIQINDIWHIEGWDTTKWDSSLWDRDYSEMFAIILKALREDILVGSDIGYFNLFFFDMVKESLSQIPAADWVYKTTYLSLNQMDNNELKQQSVYYDKKGALIKKYLEEVKPYHSKFIDQGTFTETNQDINVSVVETLTLQTSSVNYLASTNQTSDNVPKTRTIDRMRNGAVVVTENVVDLIITEDGRNVIVSDSSATPEITVIVEEG
jgi:hypothetical protein